MTTYSPPPIGDRLIDEDGKLTLAWVMFMNQLYNGDRGNLWTPSFTSLGSTGTPTFSGKFYFISKSLVYLRAIITPATDTSSTAGTTYMTGMPFTIAANGTCHAVASNLGSTGGMAVASSGRIYTPTWTSITVPVTITATLEVN